MRSDHHGGVRSVSPPGPVDMEDRWRLPPSERKDLDGGSNLIHGRRHFSLRARGERDLRDHRTQPRSAGQPAAGGSALNLSAGLLSLGYFDQPQAGPGSAST